MNPVIFYFKNTMVKIRNVSYPTYDENNTLRSAGCITLSNQIDIWFSDIHQRKTYEEAKKVADALIEALNKEGE